MPYHNQIIGWRSKKNNRLNDSELLRLILLICIFKTTEPPKTIVWYFNGNNVGTLIKAGKVSVVTQSRTSKLVISKATIKDAGKYTCEPSNALPDVVTVDVEEGVFAIKRYI